VFQLSRDLIDAVKRAHSVVALDISHRILVLGKDLLKHENFVRIGLTLARKLVELLSLLFQLVF
jgi:hypothetical protein